MSRRVFTKVFTGLLALETSAKSEFNAVESWLVQEDIEVIGAEVAIQNRNPSENDGFANVWVELSQVGVINKDGAILIGAAYEGWNSVPAGVDIANAHPVLSLPQGLAIPVKEEGYLYINAEGYGKTAGISYFIYEVIVYYTKRGG